MSTLHDLLWCAFVAVESGQLIDVIIAGLKTGVKNGTPITELQELQ